MKDAARHLTWITCLAALVLLAAPAASAGDVFLYSTADSVVYPSVGGLFPVDPLIMGVPGSSPVALDAGILVQPANLNQIVIPVSPVLASPTSILDNTASIPGAYYTGSIATGSSYTGSSWDWFRRAGTGGMCTL